MHYSDPAVRAMYPTRRMGPAPKPGRAKCLVPGCQNVSPAHKGARRGLCVRHHSDPAVRAQYPDRRCRRAKRPPLCSHCRRGAVQVRARNLCVRCYKKPAIRHLYPVAALPATLAKVEARAFRACPYPPYHPKRVETMQRRIALNQPLHHPGDAGNEAWEHVEGEAVEWASDLRIRGDLA